MSVKPAVQTTPKAVPYAWVILIVVYLASVMAPLNQFKVPPIMPMLIESFRIDLAQAGLLMSSLALVGLVLALPAGIILQRLGAKVTGIIALACIAGGAAMGALAGSFGMLLFSRVLEGMGVGLISVVAPATIAQWFPPSQQGAPMGIWATWVPVGSVVMYNAAPALALASGWQAVWWMGALLTLVVMAVYALLIRKPPADPAAPAGLQAQGPLNLGKALANRDIWLLSLTFMCFNLALVSVSTYYPTFLNTVRGYPLQEASFMASVGTLVVLFSAPLAGMLSDRLNTRRLMIAFPFLVIAALLVFPFQVTGGWIIAVLVVQGLIAGAIPTATFAAAPEVMRSPALAGLGLSVILIGQNLGQLLGPIIFGALVSSIGWLPAGLLLIPVCLVGFIAAWNVRVR